jgi:hypothetical protein
MEGLAAGVVVIAVLLGVLLVVAFDLFCLARLAARDDHSRFLKVAWAVAIVCTSPFGGLVYLLSATRLPPYVPRLGDGSLRRPRLTGTVPSPALPGKAPIPAPCSLTPASGLD